MKDWIRLQRNLTKQVLEEMKGFKIRRPKELDSYEKAFHRDFRSEKKADWNQFVKKLNQSRIFFLGDFHSFPQSQKQLLRLLKRKEIVTPEAIGLEALEPQEESRLHRLLQKPDSKKIEAFVKSLNLEEDWGSSVEVYTEVLLWAAQNKCKVFSLGARRGNLARRDKEAAKRILSQKPSARTWILMGEFHGASAHLPKEIHKLESSLEICVLQQNHDRLSLKYLPQLETQSSLLFRLPARKNLDAFCLIHTLPWVKWQSELQFKQRHSESEAEVDIHDQIEWSIATLSEFFKDARYPESLKEEGRDDFISLHTQDEAFVEALKALSNTQKRYVLEELKRKKVAVLYRQRRIFIAEARLNACAQAAAQWLLAHWTGRQSFKSKFYERSLFECLSFFLSKTLNHRRKTRSWQEWNDILRAKSEIKKLRAILLSQNFFKRSMDSDLFERELQDFSAEAAEALGRWIADQAFEAFLSGELSKQRIIRLLTTRHEQEETAYLRLSELYSLARDFRA